MNNINQLVTMMAHLNAALAAEHAAILPPEQQQLLQGVHLIIWNLTDMADGPIEGPREFRVYPSQLALNTASARMSAPLLTIRLKSKPKEIVFSVPGNDRRGRRVIFRQNAIPLKQLAHIVVSANVPETRHRVMFIFTHRPHISHPNPQLLLAHENVTQVMVYMSSNELERFLAYVDASKLFGPPQPMGQLILRNIKFFWIEYDQLIKNFERRPRRVFIEDEEDEDEEEEAVEEESGAVVRVLPKNFSLGL